MKSKQIDVHIKEYETLRSDMSFKVRQMYIFLAVYLAAIFAVLGFILSPENVKITDWPGKIKNNRFLIGAALVIPILNSILLIHIVSLMHFVFATAKYTTFVIGRKISQAVNKKDIIFWDKWDDVHKQAWNRTKILVGILYYLLAHSISIGILWYFRDVLYGGKGSFLIMFWALSASVVLLSLAESFKFLALMKKFHPGVK